MSHFLACFSTFLLCVIYERVYIILIPKFKNDFINIINNFENKLSNLESINAIIEQLDLLYKNLVINNDEILKLPKFSKKICLKLLNDIKTLKNLIYRFSILKKYNFENDAYNELIKIAQMIFKFKQYYCLNYKFRNVDVYSRIIDLMEYFNVHILNVGFGFAIRDLQLGLNLLNKKRQNSLFADKNILKEDGIFGSKTCSALFNVCKNYPLSVIKKYIKRGILNNIIFDTKNNKNINSFKLVCEVLNILDYQNEFIGGF